MKRLFDTLNNPMLPVEEVKEIISSIAGRIPLEVFAQISERVETFSKNPSSEFDVQEIMAILDSHKQSLTSDRAQSDFEIVVTGLRDIGKKYAEGLLSGQEATISDLINHYYTVESLYAQSQNIEDIVLSLRQQHSDDITKVYNIARSHLALETKNKVLLQLFSHMSHLSAVKKSPHLVPLLENLANFKEKHYSLVALEARQLLIDSKKPSSWDRLHDVEKVLREILAENLPVSETEKFASLMDQPQPLFDLLFAIMDHDDKTIREIAMELYLRRIYRPYTIETVETIEIGNVLGKKFQFKSPANSALAVGVSSANSYCDLASLLTRRDSTDTIKSEDSETPSSPTKSNVRFGGLVKFPTLHAMKKSFDEVLQIFPETDNTKEAPMNVLHVMLLEEYTEESSLLQAAEQFLKTQIASLRKHHMRRVTFAVRPHSPTPYSSPADALLYPSIYTFTDALGFCEDKVVRHIEAPSAYKLELQRLSNYNVLPLTSDLKNVHMYLAKTKPSDKHLVEEQFQRIFVRAVVRQLDRTDDSSSVLDSRHYDAHPGPERSFVDALNALELAMGNAALTSNLPTKNNHIFLNIIPEAFVDSQYVEGVIRLLFARYSDRIEQLKISEVELKLNARFSAEAECIPVRLQATSPTGIVLRVEAYVEATGPNDEPILTSIGNESHGSMDGMPTGTPYPIVFPFDKKRELAKKMSNAVYVYDYLELLEFSIMRSWKRFLRERSRKGTAAKVSIPSVVLESKELILNSDKTDVIETTRPNGMNDIGMVAWLITLYTPECREGRDIIIIANDITFKAGSFGVLEDRLFELASKLSRTKGIPRLFFSANAGARIGMAESIKALYKICWKNEANPAKGFEYLYLTEEDYNSLSTQETVIATLKTLENGEKRYIITDIIGKEKDLGVECLRGSGTIAGETARAYNDVFTLTYSCGRSVGIGAYLVRLGHRTVQNKTHSPIILTGYQALNKLMGKSVYTSNDQLGGIKIMHTNGVTHVSAKSHLYGIHSILEWLSFVPKVRRGPLLIRDIAGWEDIERPVTYSPTNKGEQYDPRWLLTGKQDESTNKWCTGFMDRNSFVETLDGWAKSVIVGRARLGGIPCGVVLTEVRTTEKTIPADPAAPLTQESQVQQAGQVWFPDSAYKTATAIKDFKGEDLPLFIFANWRGFSGGQRDMFDEVLKFGAAIVDGLVNYEQPVYVYIPPYAELRGGAWAVVDPTINEGIMEMYADPTGRGGVLEPAGLIEIKYRKKQLLETMHRLDEKLLALQRKLATLQDREKEEPAVLAAIKAREDILLPVYVQIATEFADLHDTPGRMKAKKCIREVVPWDQSRTFFYWRLKRQVQEFALRRDIMKHTTNEISFIGAEEYLLSWFTESVNAGRVPRQTNVSVAETWARSDKEVLLWFASDKEWIQARMDELALHATTHQVLELGLKNPKAAVAGILELMNQLSDKEREEAIAALRRGSIFHKR